MKEDGVDYDYENEQGKKFGQRDKISTRCLILKKQKQLLRGK